MSSDRVAAESKVSGSQANIPARIRRELDIDDGDHLRWHLEDDGSLRVQVVRQETGTFADFDGYDGEAATDVTAEHDDWASTSSRCHERWSTRRFSSRRRTDGTAPTATHCRLFGASTTARFHVDSLPTDALATGKALFRRHEPLSFVDACLVADGHASDLPYLYAVDDDFDAVDDLSRLDTATNPYDPN